MSDPFALARAARTSKYLARLEQYRQLTRDESLDAKVACRRMGISHSCGAAYEKELVRLTGVSWKIARRQRLADLIGQGLDIHQAAAELGVDVSTARIYRRDLAKAGSS